MKGKDGKFILVVLLLMVAGAISWNLYFKAYLQKDTVDIKAFPKTIADWTSEDQLITEEEYAILETRNVVARRYRSPDKKEVYLLMVYSQNNRKVSHPPEICYTGGGATIVGSTHDFIPVDSHNLLIDANKLTLELKGVKQITCYWFKVGDSFTPNYWKQQCLIAIKSLLGRPASSALIRVSADVVGNNEGKAAESIREFTRLIVPNILKYLP